MFIVQVTFCRWGLEKDEHLCGSNLCLHVNLLTAGPGYFNRGLTS